MRADRLAALLGLWGAVAVAAPQRVDPPTLFARTDLVSLAVTVTDTRGALVDDLSERQFAVYDNGERQAIQFFASDDVPATVGVLVDSSASMNGRREYLARAASALVDARNPLDELFLLHFNERVWSPLPSTMAFFEDARQFEAALAAAPAQGMTALYDAVDRGLQHVQRGSRDRRALIVISDGGDNASTHTLASVVLAARETGAVIYSVTFFDPDNHDARADVLKTLTVQTGGHAWTVKNADDVTRSFVRIAHEINTGYTIAFSPSDTSTSGFHSIRVAVDAGRGRQVIARTRAGYYGGSTTIN